MTPTPDVTSAFTAHSEFCRDVMEAHITEMSEKPLLNDVESVIKRLNKSLSASNCPPLHETTSGPHLDDRDRLSVYLTSRAMDEITNAESGCMVDMALKSYNACNRQIGARMSEGTRDMIADAVRTRVDAGVNDPSAHAWQSAMWADYGRNDCEALMVNLGRRNAVPVEPVRQLEAA